MQKTKRYWISLAILFAARLAFASDCKSAVSEANKLLRSGSDPDFLASAKVAVQICEKENIQSSPAYVLLGAGYLKNGESTKALEAYKKAEKIDPVSETIQINICSAYVEMKNESMAQKVCGKFIDQKSPRYAETAANILRRMKSAPPAADDPVAKAKKEAEENLKKEKIQNERETCISKGRINEFNEKAVEKMAVCKPWIKPDFTGLFCTEADGSNSGGASQLQAADVLLSVLKDACTENPNALAAFSKIEAVQVNSLDLQKVSVSQKTLKVGLLLGTKHESLVLTKYNEIADSLKEQLKPVLSLTFKTEQQKNDEAYEKYSQEYDQKKQSKNEVDHRRKKITAQMDDLHKKINAVPQVSSKEIAAVWMQKGLTPEKKSAESLKIQKKYEAETEKLKKEYEELEKQRDQIK